MVCSGTNTLDYAYHRDRNFWVRYDDHLVSLVICLRDLAILTRDVPRTTTQSSNPTLSGRHLYIRCECAIRGSCLPFDAWFRVPAVRRADVRRARERRWQLAAGRPCHRDGYPVSRMAVLLRRADTCTELSCEVICPDRGPPLNVPTTIIKRHPSWDDSTLCTHTRP